MTTEDMRRALWGVVANRAQKVQRARLRNRRTYSLWWHVHRVTALGSTLSQRLCVEMGFDPETGEQVRGWAELGQPADLMSGAELLAALEASPNRPTLAETAAAFPPHAPHCHPAPEPPHRCFCGALPEDA